MFSTISRVCSKTLDRQLSWEKFMGNIFLMDQIEWRVKDLVAGMYSFCFLFVILPLPLSRIAFIGQTWRMKRYTAPTGWRDTMLQRWRSTSTTPSTWWCSMNRGSPKVRHAGLWYDTDLFYFSGDIVKDRAATVSWLDEDVQVTGLHCKSGIMGSDHGCSVYQSGIMTCQCCRQTMTKKQYCTPWQQSLESSMFRPKDSLIKLS